MWKTRAGCSLKPDAGAGWQSLCVMSFKRWRARFPPLRCGCRLLRRLAVTGFVRPAAKPLAASGPALVLAPIAAVRAAVRSLLCAFAPSAWRAVLRASRCVRPGARLAPPRARNSMGRSLHLSRPPISSAAALFKWGVGAAASSRRGTINRLRFPYRNVTYNRLRFPYRNVTYNRLRFPYRNVT